MFADLLFNINNLVHFIYLYLGLFTARETFTSLYGVVAQCGERKQR